MFDSPRKLSTRALKALIWAIGLLTLLGLQTRCRADQTTQNAEDEETLAEQVNDPTATLDQFQVKDIYTPAEYGTKRTTEHIANKADLLDSRLLVDSVRSDH